MCPFLQKCHFSFVVQNKFMHPGISTLVRLLIPSLVDSTPGITCRYYIMIGDTWLLFPVVNQKRKILYV